MKVGDIFYFNVPDKNGANPKDRRCVVIKVAGSKCVVASITTKFDPNNLLPCQVRLPFGPGVGGTSLREPSVCDAQWLSLVDVPSGKKTGVLPSKLIAPILAKALQRLSQLTGEAQTASDNPRIAAAPNQE